MTWILLVIALGAGYCVGFKAAQVRMEYTVRDNLGNSYVARVDKIRPLWPWQYSGWPKDFWPFTVRKKLQ